MKYIEACQCDAWHLRIWRKDDDGVVKLVPFRCRSWRHQGECRLWKGAQDFARICEAMTKHDRWCHLVLTYPDHSGTVRPSVFRGLLRKWDILRKRLTREYGKLAYIQTWEVHKSGFPHVHIAVANEGLYAAAAGHPRTAFRVSIRDHAVSAGFGYIGWLESLRSEKAMAGYLVKLSKELVGGGKEYQVPVHAPRHFRRLRASRGLLPPVKKDKDFTGELRKEKLPSGMHQVALGPEQRGKIEQADTMSACVSLFQ